MPWKHGRIHVKYRCGHFFRTMSEELNVICNYMHCSRMFSIIYNTSIYFTNIIYRIGIYVLKYYFLLLHSAQVIYITIDT